MTTPATVKVRALPGHVDLTFRALGACDGCAAPLAPGEQLAGLCQACRVRWFPARAKRPKKRVTHEPA